MIHNYVESLSKAEKRKAHKEDRNKAKVYPLTEGNSVR